MEMMIDDIVYTASTIVRLYAVTDTAILMFCYTILKYVLSFYFMLFLYFLFLWYSNV